MVLAGLALLVALPALAEDDTKSTCRIPRFRGATSPAGATVDITVVNNGKPCRITMHSDPDARISTTELRAVEEPQHGRLELSGADVAHYIPIPGYTGPDRYAIRRSRADCQGHHGQRSPERPRDRGESLRRV